MYTVTATNRANHKAYWYNVITVHLVFFPHDSVFFTFFSYVALPAFGCTQVHAWTDEPEGQTLVGRWGGRLYDAFLSADNVEGTARTGCRFNTLVRVQKQLQHTVCVLLYSTPSGMGPADADICVLLLFLRTYPHEEVFRG